MADRLDHYSRLIRMYQTAPINRPLNSVLSIDAGSAELRMPIGEHQHHAATAVHGSVYFKMLDDAAFFAANSLVEDVCLLTASFTIEFFRPAAEGELRAVGQVTKPGKNMVFASSVLFDESGTELARGSGVFARSSIPLDADLGYA